jgi:transposase InsO family protein
MVCEGLASGLPLIDEVDRLCDACQTRKQRHTAFPSESQYRAESALELVHGDLCGLVTPATPSGNNYFLLLVDDCSRYMWVAAIPSKSCATEEIKSIQARAEVEAGAKLKVLWTDRGGEFTSIEFTEYCIGDGMNRQLTAPYYPQ